jgi:hypothetical protein
LVARSQPSLTFVWLTTSIGAHRTISSHLGGFLPRVTTSSRKIDKGKQVLKVWLALFCSLTRNHSINTLIYQLKLNLTKRGLGTVSQVLGRLSHPPTHQQL